MKQFLLAFFLPLHLQAIDLGCCGQLFPVQEENLIVALEKRFYGKPGLEEALAVAVKDLVPKDEKSFQPVAGLTRCLEERSWFFDPSFTLEAPVRDEKGEVLVERGRKISPLEDRQIASVYLFFDGTDPEQVEWAGKHIESRWILTGGDPFALSKEYGKAVYFDQGGVICEKLGIGFLPAILRQEGSELLLQEVVI